MFEKFERITHITVLGALIAIQAYLIVALICSFF